MRPGSNGTQSEGSSRAPLLRPTLVSRLLVLTFCLVLRGWDFSFSSLLWEILRNCLRSP